MILKIFTIYDSKAEAYLQPFFMKSVGEAMRAFEDAVNDDKHQFAKHIEDYTLFEVGVFDDANAEIVTLSTPKPLAKGIELLKS